MIVYLDTSSLLPLVIEEPGSNLAVRLWDEATTACAVRLVYAEGQAALAMAMRLGRLAPRDLRDAISRFEDVYAQLTIVEVTEQVVRRAGELAELRALRGYDAVHLAAALTLPTRDLVFVSGDGKLAEVARAEGLAVTRT